MSYYYYRGADALSKPKLLDEEINPLNNLPFTSEYYELKKKIDKLPASDPGIQKQLKDAVLNNDLIIISAETGAGKSVVVAPKVLEIFDFKKRVIITQPRSLNTETAKFVAKVLDDREGNKVGYAYRFHKFVGKKTILSYETDGRVLNYFYNDPNFEKADILILDEIHEKNINLELILLFMKKLLLQPNNKKKLVIMSATLDIDYYKRYFKGVKIGVLEIPGRTFPVQHIFSDEPVSVDDYLDEALYTVKDIIMDPNNPPGDILVFVPAISEIRKSCYQINKKLNKELPERVVCLTLYAGIPDDLKEFITHKDKYKQLEGNPVRKIVFSTNIAESGVTIDGLKYVIDTGRALNMKFNSATRTNVLRNEFISKFSAEQRAGRAGRTQPGIAYHLYTKEEFQRFRKAKESDILTENIDSLILNLLTAGKNFIGNIRELEVFMSELIEPPTKDQISFTIKHLRALGIIDKNNITSVGLCVSELGLDVELALTLLASSNYRVEYAIIDLVSMLSLEDNINKWFNRPSQHEKEKLKKYNKVMKKYYNKYGDVIVLHNIYESYRKQRDKVQNDIEKMKKWAKERFLHLSMLSKAKKQARALKGRYKRIKDRCEIDKTVGRGDNIKENIILSFLHGYHNQVAIKKKKGVYQLSNKKDTFELVEKEGNFITRLAPMVIYMHKLDILGTKRLSGIINVSSSKLITNISG